MAEAYQRVKIIFAGCRALDFRLKKYKLKFFFKIPEIFLVKQHDIIYV